MQLFWNPFRNSVRAYLAADGIKLHHCSGFPRKPRSAWHARLFEAADAPIWSGADRSLAEILHKEDFAGSRVDLLLSSEFVHLMMVPGAASGLTAGERGRLVQGLFARAYGDAAAAWEVRYCPTGGRELLAAAVDRPFIDALGQTVRAQGCHLRSIQPLAVYSLNRFRDRFPRAETWVVVSEPRAATIALVEGKRICHVRIRPMAGNASESLTLVLDRESRLLDRPIRQVILIGEGDLDKALAADWKLTKFPATAEPTLPAVVPATLIAGG